MDHSSVGYWVLSYQLSVISFQLSVVSFQLSVVSFQLSVFSQRRFAPSNFCTNSIKNGSVEY
ncbi:MAG TPA: hypothetical protein ENJ89_06315 [Caldithrix abyssi]|uniref:Uncharacterized protein n=1 Tax=Caldithrix abyssi TaxID=187145 RepID=A0A7V5PPC2_CALAY|nr:hypothetical protein [Caldithrix abyssi]